MHFRDEGEKSKGQRKWRACHATKKLNLRHALSYRHLLINANFGDQLYFRIRVSNLAQHACLEISSKPVSHRKRWASAAHIFFAVHVEQISAFTPLAGAAHERQAGASREQEHRVSRSVTWAAVPRSFRHWVYLCCAAYAELKSQCMVLDKNVSD